MQKELAKILNVTKACIYNWENNLTTPRPVEHKKISNFLGYCVFDKPAFTLPEKLHYIRTYLYGMDHRTFAKLVSCDESSILDWETGKVIPHINSIWRLCKTFGFQFSYQNHEVYGSIQSWNNKC